MKRGELTRARSELPLREESAGSGEVLAMNRTLRPRGAGGTKLHSQEKKDVSSRRLGEKAAGSTLRGRQDISLTTPKLGSAHVDRYNENKKEKGVRQVVTGAKRVK
jgi:hypothetical protein